MRKFWAFLSLFGSLGTLLCCAIPALLVTLGMGASLAWFISAFPQVTILSEYKEITFLVAGALVLGSWVARYYAPAPKVCFENICKETRDVSFWILVLSTLLIGIGVVSALFFKYTVN